MELSEIVVKCVGVCPALVKWWIKKKVFKILMWIDQVNEQRLLKDVFLVNYARKFDSRFGKWFSCRTDKVSST